MVEFLTRLLTYAACEHNGSRITLQNDLRLIEILKGVKKIFCTIIASGLLLLVTTSGVCDATMVA